MRGLLLYEGTLIFCGGHALKTLIVTGNFTRGHLISFGVVCVFTHEISALHYFRGANKSRLVEEVTLCVVGTQSGPLIYGLHMLVDFQDRLIGILEHRDESVCFGS